MNTSIRGRSRIRRVCIVGPSTRFLSGITYYTFGLCQALSEQVEVSAILMRRLLPARLYPGHDRVGATISTLELPAGTHSFDGVDWFWFPSLFGAIWLLLRRKPQVLHFQWWTGTVLHSYLALALVARSLRIQVVIEFHEVLDPGEAGMPWVNRYVGLVAPWLFRLASGYVVHSEYDRKLVAQRYGNAKKMVATIPHATYDHYYRGDCRRPAPEDCCHIVYFGIIRPFKGVEDLIRAFDAIPPEEIGRYWLSVVGETWEGWTLPNTLIAQSRYRDRITYVDRYVSDDEVDGIFGGADLVVLPYHRSSQSGPLHIALNYGLPVVVTAVGGLIEAVAGYEGAVLTQPGDPGALLAAIRDAQRLCGKRYPNPRSWTETGRLYQDFFSLLPTKRTSSRSAVKG